MKSGQGNDNRNNFQKINRVPYWKRKKTRPDIKKQKIESFGTNNKSVNTHFSKQGNHKVNKPKELDRGFRTRIITTKICPLCEKQIKELASCMSMKFDNEDKPIHFDCAINKVRLENNLLKNEDLVYRGIGKFFVVNKLIRGSNLAFKIIREIDFENLEDRPLWRKKILEDMNKGFKLY
ncbi:hypothetical protein DB313_03665 [Borrelia turcica IST7]|uniref:Uncharacterized protein n=1 Tax=Borrelia turcica IST7 TaxID=1104446 RepID=A0A386PP10_9SPIR|nr:hypothetical protein [Borrelia turcica]AYE36550.1 hypothetical protein DB313_03665 [Borrelia turcica IST7]